MASMTRADSHYEESGHLRYVRTVSWRGAILRHRYYYAMVSSPGCYTSAI
jgi:hypothetical protein